MFGLFNNKNKNKAEEIYQEAESLYDKENYTDAIELYKKSAELDHTEAQYSLAYCYQKGLGCDKNYSEAIKFATTAALKNHAGAQQILALIYDDEESSFHNPSKAFEWYTKAANNGKTLSMHNLGFFYRDGICVEANKGKAIDLWKKASDLGYEPSKELCESLMYIEWNMQAVALDFIFGRKNELNEQGIKNVSKGVELLLRGYKLNNENAIECIGLLYMIGLPGFFEKDYEKGLSFVVQSAKLGNTEAFFDLMSIYKNDGQFKFEGIPVGPYEKNEKLAGKYAAEIAEATNEITNDLSHGHIYTTAAWAYYFGYGVEKNYAKAYDFIVRTKPYFYTNYPVAEMIEGLKRMGYSF